MAYAFVQASSQYIYGSSAPTSGVPLTICAFIRPTTVQASAGIAVENTGSVNRFSIGTNMTTTEKRAFAQAYSGASFPASQTSQNALIAGTTYHVCGVFTSNTSRTVYLNATAATTNTTSLTVGALNNITIGGSKVNSTNEYADANLSEIAVWSAALTAEEITSLNKGFKPTRIRPQSLVFYAPIVRNLQDFKAGLALTNNNSATVTNHPRVY